ncbi:MAG TPA: lamin tail domain-containing protein, partial [Clostridia bacterium]|nr:lamin tail domain-containing protein [Clostridia bacterium]
GSSWSCSLNPPLPSPGAPNRAYAANAAPNIRQVTHSPQQPHSTNLVTVTAKITDPHGVKSATLAYQVVGPGSFIPAYIPLSVSQLKTNPAAQPAPNPAFEAPANWMLLEMHDDGMNGDTQAGDDIYTVLLPVRPSRSLVRYRITVTDTLDATRRAPFTDDPSLNFAYFVYDGVPAYGGTSAQALQGLPVYFLLTRNADFDACTAYNVADVIPQMDFNDARYVFNWPGAFVYDGQVYDHIRYRLRGANGRYMNGKRNFRFRFNEGRFFAAKDEFGNPYPRKWSSLSTAKGQSNQGTLTFSLNEYISFFLLNKVGVPAPLSHFFHWRVVRGPLEASDLYSGDFYGASWVQEEYDAAFLETHNLPKGNLYKLINARRDPDKYLDMVEQRRYQGPLAPTNGADAVRIETALLNPNSSQTDEWLLANVNYTNWYAYHSVCEAVRNYDTWPEANKNAAWFFDTDYTAANQFNGRFWTFPWDWTDTWGPTWNAGRDLAWNGMWGPTASLHTNMQRDYRNTMREMRDLLFQPDQINPLIDAIAARLAPIAVADLLRWSNCPPATSSYSSLARPGPGLFQGLAGYVQDLKNFMFVGGTYSWWVDRQSIASGGWITRLDAVSSDVAIPIRPALYYVGQPGFPMNTLTFECGPFADPQGPGTFAGIQWRLAEVWDTNQPLADPRVIPPMEWDAVWDSGVLTTWTNRVTIPGLYTQPNKLYRARVRHLDNSGRWSRWSPPVEFRVAPVDLTAELRAGLRFSEIMYNPPAMGIYAGDELEFLELKNIGTHTLDLGGLWFSGITFAFTNGTALEPGQTCVLGRNSDALRTKYPGLTVHGIYSGKLDNAGESISLMTPLGEVVLEVSYGDTPPWPVTADGLGWSLVLGDPLNGTYRVSSNVGGSPGADDPPNTLPPLLVMEVLPHTDPPWSDSVELHNPTPSSVNLKGWFLSDSSSFPTKFRINEDRVIPPGGYVVLNESDFNPGGAGLAFSSLGDETYLFSGSPTVTNLTGYVHGATYGASENSVSFGRYVNSAGEEDFVSMEQITLGITNSQPRVGPAVISEIMFQPPALGTNEQYELEFIELQNITTATVPLYDPQFPLNTWRLRNAVDFDFPPNLSLPPEGRLLIVGFDPANSAALASFRNAYGLDASVTILGPWSGRLNNSGESVELKYPDEPETDGFVPYIQVEKIAYSPKGPWPAGASGTGNSLQRIGLLAYGNEPLNWQAAPPTAGALFPDGNCDFDADGMPDFWEMRNQTDPRLADGVLDPDHDGFTNFQEWLAGTNPWDAASFLYLQAITAGSNMLLQFQAAPERSYTILTAPVPDAAIWFGVTNVSAAATNRLITVPQPAEAAAFYRLITPAQE